MRLLVMVLSLGFALSTARPAVAQPKDSETAKKVLNLLREAGDHFEEEKYAAALKRYEQAYELYPDPAILYRLGQTYEKLGNTRQAVDYYEQFIDEAPKEQVSKSLVQRLPDLKKSLLPVIRVNTSPRGATVWLGKPNEGQRLGATPLEAEVDKGEVVISVSQKGFASQSRKLDLKGGTETTISFDLVAAEGPVAAGSEAEDEDDVVVLETDDAEAGVEAESETDAVSDLEIWGWTTAGIGVATLATGGVFTLLSQSAADDVNSFDKRAPGASRAELESLKDDAEGHHDTAVIAYVAGGVILATGVGILTYEYLTADGDEVAVGIDAGYDGDRGWVGLGGQF